MDRRKVLLAGAALVGGTAGATQLGPRAARAADAWQLRWAPEAGTHGLAAFEGRTPAKIGRSSYEQRPHAFPPEHLKVFKASKAAWTWFETQPPGYRRLAIWYVVSAVRAETQAKRLGVVVTASAAQRRIIGGTSATAKAPAAKKPVAAKKATAPRKAGAAKTLTRRQA